MADAEANANTGTAQGSPTGATGAETAKENEQNPLLPDLHKWKERARAAEQALADKAAESAEAERRRELEAAKTKEEVEAIKTKWQAELAAERRALSVTRAAAAAGVHEAFVRIVDDGRLGPEDVVKAAATEQEKYNERIRTGTQTEPFGTATSPGRSGKKVWTRAEIEKLDPYAKDYPLAEIRDALAEGRVKE